MTEQQDQSRKMEDDLIQSIDAMNRQIRQGRRIVAVRRIAKNLIVTDRATEEEEEEEEEEEDINP